MTSGSLASRDENRNVTIQGVSKNNFRTPTNIAVNPDTGGVLTEISTVASQPLNSTSTAYEASRVIKSSAGTLYGFSGYSSKTSGQFILVFDSPTVPVDGSTAVIVIKVGASGNFSYDAGLAGRSFSNGISISNSSTAPTKTIGVSDCFFDIQYL